MPNSHSHRPVDIYYSFFLAYLKLSIRKQLWYLAYHRQPITSMRLYDRSVWLNETELVLMVQSK